MMDKIYIVTSGEYSDYAIEGVFSSEENAQQYMEKFGHPSDMEIEIFDVDKYTRQISQGLGIYTIVMSKNGGTLKRDYGSKGHPGNEHWVFYSDSEGMRLYATVLAKDYKHAVKIVNEQRIAILSMGFWPKWDDFENAGRRGWGSFDECKQALYEMRERRKA